MYSSQNVTTLAVSQVPDTERSTFQLYNIQSSSTASCKDQKRSEGSYANKRYSEVTFYSPGAESSGLKEQMLIEVPQT